jgi:predicted nuclease of predicted toxin-antitoxin system
LGTYRLSGLKDRLLLDRAEAEVRLVLTLDKDFWQLALMRPGGLKRCGVILFRLHPAISEKLQPLVDSMLRVEREWAAHVSIITEYGIEMFPIA